MLFDDDDMCGRMFLDNLKTQAAMFNKDTCRQTKARLGDTMRCGGKNIRIRPVTKDVGMVSASVFRCIALVPAVSKLMIDRQTVRHGWLLVQSQR